MHQFFTACVSHAVAPRPYYLQVFLFTACVSHAVAPRSYYLQVFLGLVEIWELRGKFG